MSELPRPGSDAIMGPFMQAISSGIPFRVSFGVPLVVGFLAMLATLCVLSVESVAAQSDSSDVTASDVTATDAAASDAMISDATASDPTQSVLLSRNKPATASSRNGRGVAAQFGNDGKLESRWGAAGQMPFPHWWKVDLLQSYRLTRLDMYFRQPANKYYVEVSEDDVNWIKVVDRTQDAADLESSDPLNVTARYLRVTITDSSNQWTGVWEFEVYGNDVIESLSSPPAITVTVGTPLEDVALPETVRARYRGGASQDLPVRWERGDGFEPVR